MLPESYYQLHAAANLVSGLAFWGVALSFQIFIERVKLKVTNKNNPNYDLWYSINKLNFSFITLSCVFFFCGVGHTLEAIRLWMPIGFYDYIMIVHCCTASLGIVLLILLYINLTE